MLKLLRDYLLVRITNPSTEQTQNGIIITNTNVKLPTRGIVITKGEGRRLPDGSLLPSQVEIGDEVVFHEFAGCVVKEYTDKTYTYLVLKENDIIAIVSQPPLD